MLNHKHIFTIGPVVLLALLVFNNACGGGRSKLDIKVMSVRVSDFFDMALPPHDGKVFWQANSAPLANEKLNLVLEHGAKGWSVTADHLLARTEGGLKGRLPKDDKHDLFVTEVANFLPLPDIKRSRPQGEFWQILLNLKNSKTAPASLRLNAASERGLATSLTLRDGSAAAPAAFLIPNLRIDPMALFTSWQGKLHVTLQPGEETWLCLLFDVPKGTTAANLQLAGATLSLAPDGGTFSNLSAQRIVSLGGTSLQILSIRDGCQPAFDIKVATAANRLVCAETIVVENSSEGMLMSNQLCLETEKGESYCAPDFLGQFSGMRVQGTGGSAAALVPGSAFTFYFQVPEATPLSSLRLTRKKAK